MKGEDPLAIGSPQVKASNQGHSMKGEEKGEEDRGKWKNRRRK